MRKLIFPLFLCFLLAHFTGTYLMADSVDTMPIGDIKAGMKGTGRSVFSGDTIEEFPVEILGVLTKTGPNQDIIIARLIGERFEKSGVPAGISGSPVYVDGKLIGAIAMGWAFQIEPIAGITPIGQMLSIIDRHKKETASTSPREPGEEEWQLAFEQVGDQNADPLARDLFLPVPPTGDNSFKMQRLACPLVVSGATDRVFDSITSLYSPHGFLTLKGGSTGNTQQSTAKIEAGSTIGVSLITGDMTISAVGSVTMVDRQQLLAFGHPMFNLGSVALPMQSANVHLILSSQYTSFKMASTGDDIGVIYQDRADGVLGQLGDTLEMVPMHIEIENPTIGLSRNAHYNIIPNPLFLPSLASFAFANTLGTYEKELGTSSIRVRTDLTFEGYDPISVSNIHSSHTGTASATSDILKLLSLIMNPFVELHTKSIEVHASVIDSMETASLLEIGLDREIYDSGQEIRLIMSLQNYRQPVREIRVSIPTDSTWQAGRYRLVVADQFTNFLNKVRRNPTLMKTRQFDQYLELLTRDFDRRQLYVTISQIRPGISLRGQEYSDVPRSLIPLLGTIPLSGKGAVTREHIVYRDNVPCNAEVSGFGASSFEIRQNTP